MTTQIPIEIADPTLTGGKRTILVDATVFPGGAEVERLKGWLTLIRNRANHLGPYNDEIALIGKWAQSALDGERR